MPPLVTAPNARATSSGISLGVAAVTWMCGWLGGNIAGAAALTFSGHADDPAAQRPVWVSATTALALWIPQLIALAVVSRRFASGRPAADFGLRFRPIDLVGVPIGVLCQLVVLRLVYWPLQSIWPDPFSTDELERNARDLYERATGAWVLILLVVVVLAAPFVEELVYRGLLHGAAQRRFNDWLAVVAIAAFFALIH
ncbi:MAG: CPBP family glutamic-type intramembrane protease, partial [Ilumatobacteraceae bacterium]